VIVVKHQSSLNKLLLDEMMMMMSAFVRIYTNITTGIDHLHGVMDSMPVLSEVEHGFDPS
jgi:hypothetical protein